jgi:glycosyltransferase involved in cell wall biosynthesis
VLIPGGLHYRKNAELILQACPRLLARFPNLILAVPNHSDAAYAARAAAFAPRLRLLGFVEDSELHAVYINATVVWFPSLYEGFGLPVIEAMACGAPVVTNNVSALPEKAGGCVVLADPHDAEAHVHGIESLLTDSLARQQLAETGRAHASLFTWTSAAEQLKRNFDELL